MSLTTEAIILLQSLIETPSFSKTEEKTAALLVQFFEKKSIPVFRKGNNIWVKSNNWDNNKPTILLNSHHDTVKPVSDWTRDPFEAKIEGDVLYGLGSNDAGASLVALAMCFLHFYQLDNPFNMIFAASAEEEISGKNGIASIKSDLGKIDLGIIGEPTQMQMAIAEKGLMVIDGTAQGKAGHAARTEGINAIYIAMQDIHNIIHYKFKKESKFLGKTKATVTQINAGTQHNVVPDICQFVIDVRTTESYTNREVFTLLDEMTKSDLKARSFRLNSSGIALDHPIVKKGMAMGMNCYGSPTLSDQALLDFTTIKIGVGKSARSHTANEFILLSEIREGIVKYIDLLTDLQLLSGVR
ncbi:MAG TPA: M20/M25/M40 family metallo-hydrolase [Saprospiraceae bacterium]|nr:M20/M25/M40 family metallo-hydrolase [Saprospiraceae bacterium]